ncbi:MAG: hypothetical protein J5643_05055 [Lachnospiraceae bacterium]|nr:hypothetical protein [Lachnospiraceae bacterium]
MNLDTGKMGEYADFLETKCNEIRSLCGNMEELLSVATQCLDQESGRSAARRLQDCVENIMKSVPIAEDASKRLVLAKKRVEEAEQVFHR